MSASLASFALPDARLAAFGTKDEYLAFKSAWKALTNSRAPLPPSFYAAHAILMGRDLYKAFSPSKRPHDEGQPYRAVVTALESLGYLKNVWHFELRRPSLNEEQVTALRDAIVRAAELIDPLKVSTFANRRAIASGAGQFPQAIAAAA